MPWLQILFDRDHPMCHLMNKLAGVYHESYSGLGTSRILLPHAINEAKEMIRQMHALIRWVSWDFPLFWHISLLVDPVCHTYCTAGNFGKVFNLANWWFYGRSPNLKSTKFYSDEIGQHVYVLGFVMSPNLKLAKSFWGLIRQI